ncbi:MAG: hypothetical protein IT307_04050 [Chloroflexi bacterium]|nr:hypothetical protein [Chloroflexota bacterium]
MFKQRLQGLALMLAGMGVLYLLTLARTAGWFVRLTTPVPPSLPTQALPLLDPLACLVPAIAIGSVGLIVVGARNFLAPDRWKPPKHHVYKPPRPLQRR